MRTISKHLKTAALALAMLSMTLIAEGESKSGFVRLANALCQGTGRLTMEIDGANVNDKGYQPGDVTGGISLAAGSHTVRFSREGVMEGITRVKVAPNQTTILIPFAERVPATDDRPAHWAIRILRLKQLDPEQERNASFVSVSQNPEIRVHLRAPDGNWSPVYVKRLAVTQAPIHFPRGYVPLKTAGGELASIPVASKGNYVVLLYDDEQGNLRSVNFKDRKYLSAD